MSRRAPLRRLVFWTSTGSILFSYVVMPLVILVRGAVVRRPVRSADITPTVSMVVAAYNEAGSIGAKVENILAGDYPLELLQIIVVSDGSTDATADEARRAGGDAVEVIELERVGKADALNAGVARATGDILVFSDANSMLAADALRRLVRPFADVEVGGVAGDQRYEPGSDASGERRYWDLDRALKVAESRAGNTISATGALYAIRHDLFTPVVSGVTDDFATSTAVICAGRRLVFEPSAAVYEPPAGSGKLEFDRKVRIMTRGLRGVALRRELLDPRRHGFYALQLLWHKVLRRLIAVPLVLAALSSLGLANFHPLYRLAAATQAAFYGAAVAGIGLAQREERSKLAKVLSLPAYFCLVNAAALRAAWNIVRRRRVDRWETARQE